MSTNFSRMSALKSNLQIAALLLSGLAILLAISSLPTAFNVPLHGGQVFIPASAGEAHNQLIFLYQAHLNGSIAERQRAATWLYSNATWVFDVEDADEEEVPAMPGPGITTEELRETLETLRGGWDTKTLEELEAEFDTNAQLVENLIGLITKGFPVSEDDIQMAIKTIWAQQLLGPEIIERMRENEGG